MIYTHNTVGLSYWSKLHEGSDPGGIFHSHYISQLPMLGEFVTKHSKIKEKTW